MKAIGVAIGGKGGSASVSLRPAIALTCQNNPKKSPMSVSTMVTGVRLPGTTLVTAKAKSNAATPQTITRQK